MVIKETSVFTRRVQKLLTDDEYRELQIALMRDPGKGQIMVGSGGLRKVRWRASGRGKSSGVRTIYYWAVDNDQLLMLLIYSKSERDDLSLDQIKALRAIVESEYP